MTEVARDGDRARGDADRQILLTLARVAAVVNADPDLSRILRTVLDAAAELTGAQYAAMYSLATQRRVVGDPPNEALTLVAASGAPADALVPGARLQVEDLLGPQVAEGSRIGDLAAPGPDVRWVPASGVPFGGLPVRSYLAVPVIGTADGVLGVLVLGHAAPARFTERSGRFAVGIAGQASAAIVRTRLFEGEARARRVAERTTARLALLQDITASMSEAHDTTAVVAALCQRTLQAFGAASAAVLTLDEDTGMFRVLGAYGADQDTLACLGSCRVSADLPPGTAVRTLQTVHIAGVEERVRRFPALAGWAPTQRAHAVVPLLMDEGAVGCLALGWPTERDLPDEDRSLLEAAGRQCAQALERARLFEAEKDARESAEAMAQRLRLQQDLAARLSRAVDTEGVASVIVRYAISALEATDVAVFRLDARRRELIFVQGHGRGATASDGPGEPPERIVLAAETRSPSRDAVRTGSLVVVQDAAHARSAYPDLREDILAPGQALACVPLLIEGRPVGLLAATFAGPLDWSADTEAFLDAVAHQCAQALERASLYEQTRRVAATLQHSLLPQNPPSIPGLDVAVRYRPMSRRAEVGGDFYDAFRIAPGRWGAVIGDVSGKGIPAASLTALARYTIRAAAKREGSPSDVLALLNEAVLEADLEEDRFCTVAYLELVPDETGTAVRMSLGGHPQPVLRRADGTVRTVGRPGMAIGLLPMVDVDDDEVLLRRGDLLALVTDGILEARAPDGRFAVGLVERVLADAGGADAEEVADRIERAALDFQAGDPRDDLAVVVLRVPTDGDCPWPPGSAAMTFDGEPVSVGKARRCIKAFLKEHGLDGEEHADFADTATLLISEVVTNAVAHAATAVGLRIYVVGDRLRVEVSDGSRRRPIRREIDLEADRGRGLLLLDRLAATWSVRRMRYGKTVSFELALPRPT